MPYLGLILKRGIVLLECLVVGKIFSRVSTHQGLILELVYPWYTKTRFKRRKINSFTNEKYLIFNIHTISIEEKNTKMCHN